MGASDNLIGLSRPLVKPFQRRLYVHKSSSVSIQEGGGGVTPVMNPSPASALVQPES